MSIPHRIGVLLSGRGSNFRALYEACQSGAIPCAEIAVVLSNKTDAPGLEFARQHGIPALAIPKSGRSRADQDAEFVLNLQKHSVDLVCLAGYMRLLSPEFIAAFPQKILNIHPSLLPAFPGLDSQKQALEYGVRTAGCTVHFVDEELDHGVIVEQATVPVHADDDEYSLAARILAEEHCIYPLAVAKVLSGRYAVVGRRFLPHGNV